MRASLGPPGTWQSRYSFRVRVPWGPDSPMREGVTRRMQTDLGGFTTLGNDNNIYICSIAPSGWWFEIMDIIYKGNQLSHSPQTSGRDINVFKSKTRDYNILPRPCCILIFSYTTSAPHISLLEYWSLLMATTDRILCEETSNSAQQTQDWKTRESLTIFGSDTSFSAIK